MSNAELAKSFNVTESTIKRIIRELKSKQLIIIEGINPRKIFINRVKNEPLTGSKTTPYRVKNDPLTGSKMTPYNNKDNNNYNNNYTGAKMPPVKGKDYL